MGHDMFNAKVCLSGVHVCSLYMSEAFSIFKYSFFFTYSSIYASAFVHQVLAGMLRLPVILLFDGFTHIDNQFLVLHEI